MIYNLNNEFDREPFVQYCKNLLDKRRAVQLVVKYPKRSIAQNRYLHLLLGWFACQTGYSVAEVKDLIFKRKCSPDIFIKNVSTKWGDAEMMRSSKDVSTAELSTAITRFRNWSVSVAGIYLPAANEGEYLLHIEAEIDKAKEYIEQPQ